LLNPFLKFEHTICFAQSEKHLNHFSVSQSSRLLGVAFVFVA
jgi:hypothetical protein